MSYKKIEKDDIESYVKEFWQGFLKVKMCV